jgi:hypothetical protein
MSLHFLVMSTFLQSAGSPDRVISQLLTLSMPPKSAVGKEKLPENAQDEVLQAVILADSFNNRFKPLTIHTPRVRTFGLMACNH